jgi:lipopolysaccharide transport system ATP-binding protein
VLSVGDAEFQRKSMGKMKDSARSGRTVLFVSHNMTAMRALCSRVIWLDQGRVRMQGPTEEVVAAYLANYGQVTTERRWSLADSPGSEVARLRHASVRPASGGVAFLWEDAVEVELGLDIHKPEGSLVNIQVVNAEDTVVFTTKHREGMAEARLATGPAVLRCTFPGHLFNAGEYRLNIGVSHHGRMSFREEHAVAFTVTEPPRTDSWHGKRKGLIRLSIPWEQLPLHEAQPHEPPGSRGAKP